MKFKPKNQSELPLWVQTGHPRPTTRREFMASGIIPFSVWAIAPSLTTLISRSANAADCGGGDAALIPFITINLQGGAGLAGTYVVRDLNNAYLGSYTKLGLGAGPTKSFNIEREFGNAEFPGTAIGGSTTGIVSKLLSSIRQPRAGMTANITAIQKTAFVASAIRSGDDTANNPLDISGLVMKLGMNGQRLPNLGTADTLTGINQRAASVPPPAPFIVKDIASMTNALGYTSALANFSVSQKAAIAKAVNQLSSEQIKNMGQVRGIASTLNLVECSGRKNLELINAGAADINPFPRTEVVNGKALGAELGRIWQVAGNVSATSGDFAPTTGAMIYNALIGNAATVNINLGGYDYHNSTRTLGNTKDAEVGSLIGKILETAEYLQKPVFIYLCTDGATTSTESATADSAWVSDRGIAGSQMMFAFTPNGRREVSSNLIGGFNDSQAADESFVTGNNPELAATAVFANYAMLNGRPDFLEKFRILGDAATRAKILRFGV